MPSVTPSSVCAGVDFRALGELLKLCTPPTGYRDGSVGFIEDGALKLGELLTRIDDRVLVAEIDCKLVKVNRSSAVFDSSQNAA